VTLTQKRKIAAALREQRQQEKRARREQRQKAKQARREQRAQKESRDSIGMASHS
jgi:hypothetical protein